MSGLLLASTAEGERPTSGEDSDWKKRFDVPPTTVRTFARSDELTLLDEIYNNGGGDAAVDATTTLQNEQGREGSTGMKSWRGGRSIRITSQSSSGIWIRGITC
ncbi:MAG TPA: hypothetical protein VHZ73_10980 [Vicinamibacterales bacterium]|jgi:hypothetical protein|nr:hypothetical protein [Vicinamibacterales bacterium]